MTPPAGGGPGGRPGGGGAGGGEREGVVKYDARHTETALDPGLAPLAAALAAWRHPLRALGWLGREEGRYGGYGFGNLSARVPGELTRSLGLAPEAHPFLVTGSQTGGEERLGLAGFALVERHDTEANRLWSRGEVPASSESLTHAAIYAAAPDVGAVFHVHAPELWRRRRELGLSETGSEVAYGTPEMARKVAEVARTDGARTDGVRTEVARAESRGGGDGEPGGAGLLAMAGHEDGILAWGPDPAAAGRALLTAVGWW